VLQIQEAKAKFDEKKETKDMNGDGDLSENVSKHSKSSSKKRKKSLGLAQMAENMTPLTDEKALQHPV